MVHLVKNSTFNGLCSKSVGIIVYSLDTSRNEYLVSTQQNMPIYVQRMV